MRGIATLVFILYFSLGFSQNGALKGKVLDKETEEPIGLVNVMVIDSAGIQIAGGPTDLDGKFSIKPIPPGQYSIQTRSVGYLPVQIDWLIINADKITFQDIKLNKIQEKQNRKQKSYGVKLVPVKK